MLSHIKRVDIEFHSYCNRLCDWCPNKKLLRNNNDFILSDADYTNILNSLCTNNFSKPKKPLKYTTPIGRKESATTFSFLGYQEPFSSPNLFKRRVQEAWEKLPSSTIITAATNGDFLTLEALEELPLTILLINDYDNKGLEYWKDRLKELQILILEENKNTEMIYGFHRYVGSIRVQCNWTKHWEIENRGGFFQPGDLPEMIWKDDMDERDFPCYEPSEYLSISYDGSVMPCCHMRPDNPNHVEYILGNIKENSLEEIILSNRYYDFANHLRQRDVAYPEPCKYCQKSRPINILEQDAWSGFREFWFSNRFAADDYPKLIL